MYDDYVKDDLDFDGDKDLSDLYLQMDMIYEDEQEDDREFLDYDED